METNISAMHQMIKNRADSIAEQGSAGTVILWEQIAFNIIEVIGETGFDSLYARSIYLDRIESLLIPCDVPLTEDHKNNRFYDLEKSFQGRTNAQINETNIVLLTTLADVLSSLIGEHLTVLILRV
ncbi:hypothetical protein RGU72_20775 [Undibacterium sp. 5I1]|uniref:hypothetical protein n=1 Tax=unclassified Undibacterium TaxID=2630295 RepID=UPI002AB4E578|nr:MULTISPECIES: hypothetical protein [unclassified Undibacterium]MDY7540690.1 hypothetical protein [Undibacterium sp. 5I1]MEB0232849.1 hypothetical protein [Undibacterium sp. 10I3]MEB0259730.1 hypothetical protein [Undibacterium sp. 5I1]